MTKTATQMLSQPFYARLLIIAAMLHLCAAWFSLGSFATDEHYDILATAAHKNGDIALEDGNDASEWIPRFHDLQLRSAFLPSITYGILQILPSNADAPFTATFILRLLSVILGFAASLAFFLAYQKEIKSDTARRWVLAAMLLCWVTLFFHARISSDGWMGSLILLAFAFLRFNRFLLAGVAFGLAFAVRYQAGFMLLPLALWVLFILRPKARDITLLAAGGVAALLGAFFIDWWFYGEPTLPWLNYLTSEILYVLPTSSIARVQPPPTMYWIHGGTMLAPIGFILPVVLAAFWVKFPRHSLVWVTALYVALHVYLSQRELRYAYQILIFMPFITAMVWQEFIEQRAALRRGFLWLLKITAAINMPLIAFAAFYPAANEIKLLRDCILPNMRDGTAAYYYAQGKSNRVVRQFYLREKTIMPVQDESELREQLANSGEGEVLYISRRPRDKQLEESGISHTRLCSVLPEWILHFNFNNWVERSSSYPVYRVYLE